MSLTVDAKPTLVLLHGWGYDKACWPRSMLEQLELTYQLIMVDLPGHGDDVFIADNRSCIEQLDQWIISTKSHLPSHYHLLGWSLGGQIAIRMAHGDDRIKSLALMATNPKFICNGHWPKAMSKELLTQFERDYQTIPGKTLRRFASLQAQGCTKPKTQAAQLAMLMHEQPQKAFGLQLLRELDERNHLSQLSQPCFIELAQDDILVPWQWVSQITLPDTAQINYVAGGHSYLLERGSVETAMVKFFQNRTGP